MALLNYSFSLTPPAPPAAARRAFSDSEFQLELAAAWRPIPTQEENTLTFRWDADGTALIISADFHEIPADQAQAVAEQCVGSRIEAHRAASRAPLTVLHRAIQPHSSGAGLEMAYAAESAGEHVHLYLGYVTSRKLLNFSMVCPLARPAAVALFNATVPGFRPRLP